ncbi:MAG: ubiquinol-cytochrome c reductase iron-sulfur subunit [Bacteroidia bacterium]
MALSSILEGCVSTNYFAQSTLGNNQLIIKKSEFIKTEKGKETQRKYVLVKSEKLNFPICIYKTDEQNYTALFMECTHKGCELQPHGDYLICPCHGSEFSNKGIVQNPPAEENLKTFIIKTDNENIYIYL